MREARFGFMLSRVRSEAQFFLGGVRVHRKNEGHMRDALIVVFFCSGLQ